MKKFLKVSILILIGILVVTAFGAFTANNETETANPKETVIFPHGEIIDVYIEIDETALQEMFENATAEEYVTCNIVYNGYYVKNVAIRPKGNSSLRTVANSDSNRYSFKLDFNEYVKGQNFFGITKINLNNSYNDPSMMREYLSYEISETLGLATPETAYVALYINDEYFGLYVSVESVDENFVRDNFDYGYGDLYKPEGIGADLQYIDDNPESYTGLGLQTNTETSDMSTVIEMIETLENGNYEELENIMDVDSFLRYYALCSSISSMDTIFAGMNHNYYLYDNDGKIVMIPWDFNMGFGGFPMANEETSINLFIDSPSIKGSLNVIDKLLSNEEYRERYHEYLREIIDNYINEGYFNNRVQEVFELIDSYVKEDQNSFYTYEEFLASFDTKIQNTPGLVSFNTTRVGNIEKQLSGELPSEGEYTQTQRSGRDFGGMQEGGQDSFPQMGGMPDITEMLGKIPEDMLAQLIMEYNELPEESETTEPSDVKSTPEQEMNMESRELPEGMDISKMPTGSDPPNRPTDSDFSVKPGNPGFDNSERNTVSEESQPGESESNIEDVIVINGYEIDSEMQAWIMEKMMSQMRGMKGMMGAPDNRMENMNRPANMDGENMEPPNGEVGRNQGFDDGFERELPDDSQSEENGKDVTLATISSLVLLLIALVFIKFKRKI